MRGSAVFRTGVAPGGVLAGPWVRDPLWTRARAVPSLDLRFADNKSLVDATTGQNLVTFTRASSGTFTGSDGVLQSAANDVPRFDHNPTTGESLGLLVEEQRTNLSLRSQELDNAAWTKTASSITADAITSPNGTTTADKLVEDSSTGTHNIVEAAAITYTSGVAYSFSFFVKKAERQTVEIRMHPGPFPGTFGQRTAIFNSNTGAFVSVGSAYTNSSVTAFPSGWYRVSVASTADATATGNFTISLCSNDAGTVSYTGDGTSGLSLWGAQLEVGAFPTSYIATTTAAATRSADVASITGSAFTGFYRQDEGTVFSDCVGTHSATQVLVNISATAANTGSSSIAIASNLTSSQKRVRVRDAASADQASFALGASSSGSRTRIAAAIKENDFAASLDGGAAVTDATGTVPTVALMEIGSSPSGVTLGTQIHRRICYWPQRLGNEVLQSITQ